MAKGKKHDKQRGNVAVSFLHEEAPVRSIVKEKVVHGINKLSNEILIDIISLLSTKEAVRTCVISQRWRNLWKQVRCLNLDDSDSWSNPSLKRRERGSRTTDLVGRIVDSHQLATLDEFKIRSSLLDRGSSWEIDKWIKFAVRKFVKRLEIDLKGCRRQQNYHLTEQLFESTPGDNCTDDLPTDQSILKEARAKKNRKEGERVKRSTRGSEIRDLPWDADQSIYSFFWANFSFPDNSDDEGDQQIEIDQDEDQPQFFYKQKLLKPIDEDSLSVFEALIPPSFDYESPSGNRIDLEEDEDPPPPFDYFPVEISEIIPGHDNCRVFPEFLKHLSLNCVDISGALVEQFLSNCKFLEHLCISASGELRDLRVVGSSLQLKFLQISECPLLEKVEIYAPNLVSFIYLGASQYREGILLNHAPSLVELSLGEENDYIVGAFQAASDYFPQLETLSLHFNSWKTIELPEFPKLTGLKDLTLSIEANEGRSILDLTKLLEGALSLGRFTLKLNWKSTAHAPQKNSRYMRKVAEFSGFIASTSDTKSAVYLIENANVLKKVVIALQKVIAERPVEFITSQDKLDSEAIRKHTSQLGTKLPRGVDFSIL